jgi:hypothetical protein
MRDGRMHLTDSEDEAKADAQRDFDARIRSALTPGSSQ